MDAKSIFKKMIALQFLSVVICGCFLFASATVSAKDEEQQPVLKIGATYALSGPAAIYSKTIVNAIEMAEKDIEAKGDIELSIILEDDRTEKSEAINMYQKFIVRDKVMVIMGPLLGRQVFAAGPIAQDKKTPVMLTSVATPDVCDIGDYIFRTSVESADIIPLAVKAAKEKRGIKKVAVFYTQDDEFATGEYKAFKRALENNNIEVLTTETFNTGDMDFRSQLNRAKSKDPDAIVIAAQGEEVVTITTQARNMGIEKTFIGGNAFNSLSVIEEAGDAMEGSISATPWYLNLDNKKNKAFVRSYRKKFNEDPDWLAAQTYDGLMLLAYAFKKSEIKASEDIVTVRQKLRDSISQIDSYEGVLGEIGFKENGDPDIPGAVVTVKNGRYTKLGE